jgi:hypothetical protein
LPVDNVTRVVIAQWAGEAQVAFGWVEDGEWLVWGGEHLLLNLAKEVCDEQAAAEKAQKVAETMEAKRRREEQAVRERKEREAAAAARKLEFKERRHALRVAFKVKEIDVAGLREVAVTLEREKKGIEESTAESAKQSQGVESEEDGSKDEMEESDEVQIVKTPVSTRGTAPKKTKRKAATSEVVYAAVSGLVSHPSQLSHCC